MTLKIPKNFRGIDGRKELERILNEIPKEEIYKEIGKTESPIVQPSGELRFITDVNEYNEIVKYFDSSFKEHKDILSKNLSFDSVMKGSNTYIEKAIDMYLKSINSEYRLATQLDLEQNLSFTKDTYNDSGLALRNLIGTNKEQAEYLFEQLKKKGITDKNFPIWFNLRGLDLDDNLNFNLTDESLFKTAECLNWKNGTHYSVIDDYGLTKEEDSSSKRQIWTDKGYALSRCYLNRNSNLDSNDSILSFSNDDGRVVLAKLRRS